MSADPFARVKRAARDKRRADHEYRAAILAAADAGESFADIAHEAGVTRQTVRVLVTRARVRN